MASSRFAYMRHKASEFRAVAAEADPDLARRLLAIAAELEAEADNLEGRVEEVVSQFALSALYRVYLVDRRGATVGHQAVFADNDDEALTIATLLCDACSDVCDTFELWRDYRRVDTLFSERRPVDVAELPLRVQEAVAEREERLRQSRWAVAESKRLLELTAHLVKQVKPRPRLGS